MDAAEGGNDSIEHKNDGIEEVDSTNNWYHLIEGCLL